MKILAWSIIIIFVIAILLSLYVMTGFIETLLIIAIIAFISGFSWAVNYLIYGY